MEDVLSEFFFSNKMWILVSKEKNWYALLSSNLI